MRSDGRLDEQLRPTRITPNFSIHAEGSVMVEAGKTKVLCTVTFQDEKLIEGKRGARRG